MKNFKLTHTSGQHILEYTTFIAIIIGVMIVMGPYIIRSWNAWMKGWDDSISDSFEEPVRQATSDEIAAPFSNCSCEWLNPCTGTVDSTVLCCGVAQGRPNGCQSEETGLVYECSPNACDDGSDFQDGDIHCSESNDCCSEWLTLSDKNLCGITCTAEEDCQKRTCLSENQTSINEFRCIPSEKPPTTCTPAYSIFENLPAYGDICPDSPTEVTINTPWTFVDFGDCENHQTTPCVAQCSPGSRYSEDRKSCIPEKVCAIGGIYEKHNQICFKRNPVTNDCSCPQASFGLIYYPRHIGHRRYNGSQLSNIFICSTC